MQNNLDQNTLAEQKAAYEFYKQEQYKKAQQYEQYLKQQEEQNSNQYDIINTEADMKTAYPTLDQQEDNVSKNQKKTVKDVKYQQFSDEMESQYQGQQQQQENQPKFCVKQKTQEIGQRISSEIEKKKLSRKSQKLPCKHCLKEVDSEVKFVAGEATGFLAGALLCSTVFLAPIPYCINATKDAVHYCPYCNNQIVIKHAWKLNHLLNKMKDQSK